MKISSEETARVNLASRLRAQDWYVSEVNLVQARDLVVKYHYAKGASNTAVYIHGLYHRESGKLCGLVWWLPPTRVACESVNKLHWTKVLALSRMVMIPGTPKNSASFLLSRSIKIIKRDGRFYSLVTYADESQGHTGGVYRAANWQYVGRTKPTPRWVDPLSGRQVACKSTVNRNSEKMRSLGYIREGAYCKHKFVLHINRSAA